MKQIQLLIGTVVGLTLCSTGAYGNDCHLLPDSGSCGDGTTGKEEIRYYYSYVNMKCTEFPYSGCGGNANNFKNVEECKRQCGTTNLPVIAQIVSAQTELKCWYGNKTYAVGESIPEATTDNPCSMGCFCSGSSPGKPPRITCATVDCQPFPDQDDCVPTHKEGSCCPEYYCPQPGQTEPVHKCKYNGKEYVEGQTIYPDDYPCVTCACNKNFKGVLSTEGGVCREVNCGLQVHNQANIVKGCIPKFFTTSKGRQSCCPIEWNCNNAKPQSIPPKSPESRR